MKARDRRVHQPNLGIRTYDQRSYRWIKRCVKGQEAERAQAVVGDNLRLRVELPGEVGLMRVAEGNELRAENEDTDDARNRLCVTANQCPNTTSP